MNIIEKSVHPCPQVVGVFWAARPFFPQPPPCPTFPGETKVPNLAKRCNHSSVSWVCPRASSRGLFPVWHVQNCSPRRCPGGILVRYPNSLTPFVVEDERLYSEWPWPVSKLGVANLWRKPLLRSIISFFQSLRRACGHKWEQEFRSTSQHCFHAQLSLHNVPADAAPIHLSVPRFTLPQLVKNVSIYLFFLMVKQAVNCFM